MRASRLVWRGLRHYWRSHLVVGLGVALATAILTGALVVGDSMRGSLRDVALARLGGITHALTGPRLVRQDLATEVGGQTGAVAAPVLLLQGAVTHGDTGARANAVSVLGVDVRFSRLGPLEGLPPLARGEVALNAALAKELDAQVGADVLVTVPRPAAIALDSLLGEREDTTISRRLRVAAIVSNDGLGGFALTPRHARPVNAFVGLGTLQEIVAQPERINTILLRVPPPVGPVDPARTPDGALRQHLQPVDFGLALRPDLDRRWLTVESASLLLEPPVEAGVNTAAADLRAWAIDVSTYLANTIRVRGTEREAPYSTVTAIDEDAGEPFVALFAPGAGQRPIVINAWLAEDLDADVGDELELEYDMVGADGQLETRVATFHVVAIAAMTPEVADPGFAPAFPGVTDSDRIADWDPPFPVDLDRIRARDEDYWDEYRAAPKAFVRLADGVELWGESDDRLGALTGVRLRPRGGDVGELATALPPALRQAIDPAQLGLVFQSVRELALRASRGSTDFSGLFIGFSLFLVVSAGMLIVLLFKLGVERRARDLGLLLATGYTPRAAGRLFVLEGAIAAALGATVGVLAGIAYGWLMLTGLRTWWSAAIGGAQLAPHITTRALGIGWCVGLALALLTMILALRGVTGVAVRLLLSGQAARTGSDRRSGRVARRVGLSAAGLAATALIASSAGLAPLTVGYFLGGAMALVACLAWFRSSLAAPRATGAIVGLRGQARLGLANIARRPGRSLLTVSLIASATFLIVSLSAFQLDSDDVDDKGGGAGGFSYWAEATTPLPVDPSTAQGRETLLLDPEVEDTLNAGELFALRLRPGSAASCLNLYLPSEPRLLGAPTAFLRRGGFRFSQRMTAGRDWAALEDELEDGAIPVIGDEAAVPVATAQGARRRPRDS